MRHFFSRFWLVMVFGIFFATGCSSPKCGEDINCVMEAPENSAPWPSEVKTDSLDQLVGEVRVVSRDARRGAGWWWCYLSALVFHLGVFLFPGKGRAEKLGEGALQALGGGLLIAVAVNFRYDYISFFGWVLILFGVGLVVWGILSSEQSGKMRIFLWIPLGIHFLFWVFTIFGGIHAFLAGSFLALLIVLALKVGFLKSLFT